MNRIRQHLTYANVVATLALFLALAGGSVYAASKLKANSVGTKQIKNNAVTGAKANEATFDQVPSAANATTAGNASTLNGLSSSAFAPAGSEAWHELGAAVANVCASDGNFCDHGVVRNCRFENLNVFAGFSTGAYLREPSGFVHLKGVVKRTGPDCGLGGTDVIFRLPPGYTPATTEIFTITSNDLSGTVYLNDSVGPTRAVKVHTGAPDTWLSLDGISFRCAPSGADGCP